MMFRKGSRPMWEDFLEGGTWIIHFKRKDWEILNRKWEALLLGKILFFTYISLYWRRI